MPHTPKQIRQVLSACLVILGLAVLPAALGADSYSLENLCKIALTSSEKLKLAEQNIALAEAKTDQALAYLYPSLTVTGGRTHYSERKYTGTGGILQPDSVSAGPQSG